MKELKHISALAAMLMALAILAAGCAVPVTEKLGLETTAAGVTLTVRLASANSRTVAPTSVPTASSYALSGSDASGNQIDGQTSSDGKFTVSNLAPGDWTFTVTGYDADNNAILSGNTTASVTAGSAVAKEITLAPCAVASTPGSISITISWPADRTVTAIAATLADTGSDLSFSIGNSSATCIVPDVQAGAHTITVTLKNGTRRVARTLTETVLIYNGVTTDWTIALEDADFGTGAQIIYNLGPNGTGTPPTDDNFYASGSKATILDNTDTVDNLNNVITNVATDSFNYFVAAWNTAENGTGTTYAIGSTVTPGSSDINLYPVWASTNGLTMSGTVVTSFDTEPSGDFTVPEGVTEIAAGALSATSNLTSLTLPTTLKKLGTGLLNRSNVKTVTIKATGLKELPAETFNLLQFPYKRRPERLHRGYRRTCVR